MWLNEQLHAGIYKGEAFNKPQSFDCVKTIFMWSKESCPEWSGPYFFLWQKMYLTVKNVYYFFIKISCVIKYNVKMQHQIQYIYLYAYHLFYKPEAFTTCKRWYNAVFYSTANSKAFISDGAFAVFSTQCA